MKKMKAKRLFAVLLTLAMVLGMTSMAFAVEGDPTTPEDTPQTGSTTTNATIKGVYPENPEAIVNAYQIVTYNQDGFYEVCDDLKNYIETDQTTNTIRLTSATVQDLYYNHLSEVKRGTGVTFGAIQGKEGEYEYENLGLGSWLVVVTSPSGKYLYNPAIISVSQTPTGVDYGALNLATDSWLGEEGTYLKRDEPTIEKTAESTSTEENKLNVVGTQYGDILKYTITADIPAYTVSRSDITYKITDTIKGLSYVVDDEHPVAVSVGGICVSGTAVSDSSSTTDAGWAFDRVVEKISTAASGSATSFVVDNFGDSFLTANSNGKIVITYYAKVTSYQLVNVDLLNNKAELDYSNNNDNDKDEGHSGTETKHYTFGIDVAASGSAISQNKTGEFIKVDDLGNVKYVESTTEVQVTSGSALSGAAFELRIGSPASNAALFADNLGNTTFTTDQYGRLPIAGLDDGVKYYLVEVQAPSGYSLNANPIKIEIKAEYGVDKVTQKQDILTGYTVYIGDEIVGEDGQKKIPSVSHYSYDTEKGETTIINTEQTPSNPFGFKNTTLSNLPSTGGIGTTIFTIAGCLIMILAAALFFASRRKTSKK